MYTKIDEDGQPVGYPSNFPPEDGAPELWVPLVNPPPSLSFAQTLVYDMVGGRCVGRWVGSADPLDALATLEQIKEKHRELEQSPITVFGELFDCDALSELRMRDALETWDDRPVLPNLFDDVLIEGVMTRVLYWTRGDNVIVSLSKEQLQYIFDEMLKQRAIRGAMLYAKYRQFKNDPSTTIKDTLHLANWND